MFVSILCIIAKEMFKRATVIKVILVKKEKERKKERNKQTQKARDRERERKEGSNAGQTDKAVPIALSTFQSGASNSK